MLVMSCTTCNAQWQHSAAISSDSLMRELMSLMHACRYGFIVMDGNGSLFGTLSGNTREVLHKFTVDLPKKHGRGGQSALRFARLRMEKRHNYVRKVRRRDAAAEARHLPSEHACWDSALLQSCMSGRHHQSSPIWQPQKAIFEHCLLCLCTTALPCTSGCSLRLQAHKCVIGRWTGLH